MKNKASLVLFLLFIGVSTGYSQQKTQQKTSEKKLPKGWDTVLLDDKTAYMNLVTGRISRTFPVESAVKPVPKKEFDPTIIHKVEKGETLSSIARKYNLKLAKLYKLNSVANFDALKIGQEIVVGYAKNTSEKKAFLNTATTQLVQKPTEKPTEKSTQKIIEKPIEKTGKVSENITKTINLSEFKLKKKPKQTDYHVVATGETLYRIASKYKISVKKLKELNHIKNNTIAIGQKLKVN